MMENINFDEEFYTAWRDPQPEDFNKPLPIKTINIKCNNCYQETKIAYLFGIYAKDDIYCKYCGSKKYEIIQHSCTDITAR